MCGGENAKMIQSRSFTLDESNQARGESMELDKQFDKQFSEVVRMIHKARYNAIKSVNTELVKLYWNVGEYISRKVESAKSLSEKSSSSEGNPGTSC